MCAVTMDMDRDGWRLPFLFFFFEGSIFFSSSVFALFAALFGDNNLVCFFVFVFFFPSLKLGRFGALGA